MENLKIVRAAVYIRTSTTEQSLTGPSFEAQEDECKKFCEAMGYDLNPNYIYREVASGSSADNRPVLLSMFKAAENKEFDTIVVYRTDRLARNLRVLLNIIDRMHTFSVQVKSVIEPFESDTSTGKMVLTMLGMFAEYETRGCGGRCNNKDGK